MMTKTKRWLDELPLESSERELLLVGKAARPARGAIDANWRALSLALGTTAAATGAGTSVVAAHSVSAKIGGSLAAGKVASAGLWLASVKSLAIGVALGLTVMGAGALVERSSRTTERAATVAEPTQPRTAHRATSEPAPTPFATPPGELAVPPTSSAQGGVAMPGSSPSRERSGAGSASLSQPGAPSAGTATSPADKAASLSQQARELAELKRLIDSGAGSEALRRLDSNSNADAASVLSEERDALYVQALDRAQRREEARAFARRFMARYPHSPYFGTMRRLLTAE